MGYTIQNAADDSIQALCQLFKEVFYQEISPAEWRWKYHDPALAGHENVILRDESGLILGHGGAVILDGWIEGKPVPVAQICDVMLAKEARGHAALNGPYAAFMSSLFRTLQAKIPDGMYYGFPGKRPFLLGKRLGFYRGTGPISEWRLALPAITRSRFSWWRLIDMPWDDERLDRLWLKRANTYHGILLMNRRYLDWRYARNPLHQYQLFGLKRGPQLTGWVVVSQTGDLLRCIDRLIDENHLLILLSLLTRVGLERSCRELAWWAPAACSRPQGASTVETGIMGTVVTASAPRFSTLVPPWQPGNVDVF